MSLPVKFADTGLEILDPDTGEVTTVENASDRALAHAHDQLAAFDQQMLAAKRSIAMEMRDRHGVGTAHAGGYGFTVNESQSWPVGATRDALQQLLDEGVITEADYLRAMPDKPKPDPRQLKALLNRLMLQNPDRARILAKACTVSPPSLRDVRRESVEGRAA